jgi:hypothetical protein
MVAISLLEILTWIHLVRVLVSWSWQYWRQGDFCCRLDGVNIHFAIIYYTSILFTLFPIRYAIGAIIYGYYMYIQFAM